MCSSDLNRRVLYLLRGAKSVVGSPLRGNRRRVDQRIQAAPIKENSWNPAPRDTGGLSLSGLSRRVSEPTVVADRRLARPIAPHRFIALRRLGRRRQIGRASCRERV